jgi:hypothetical protein
VIEPACSSGSRSRWSILLTFQKNSKADIGQLRCRLRMSSSATALTDKHLASRIVAIDDEIISWLRRRKGSGANPDNRQGHREADTYRTAKHHHEI